MVLDLSTKSTRKDIPDWLSLRKKWIRVLLVQVHDADRRLKECFRYHLIVCSDVDVVCSHKSYLLWDYLGLLSSLKINFC